MNRAEQLKRAIRNARLPASRVVLYDTITDRADWLTGHLPDQHQPRSVDELARWAGLPRSVTMAALAELEAFGWIRRDKPAILRRGLATTYQPAEGRARPPRPAPAPGSVRTRRWRHRKTADQPQRDEKPGLIVTKNLDPKSVQQPVTQPQVNGTSAQWATVGGVVGSPFFEPAREGFGYWPRGSKGAEANRGLPWQPDEEG